jgi:hypothetical protein
VLGAATAGEVTDSGGKHNTGSDGGIPFFRLTDESVAVLTRMVAGEREGKVDSDSVKKVRRRYLAKLKKELPAVQAGYEESEILHHTRAIEFFSAS